MLMVLQGKQQPAISVLQMLVFIACLAAQWADLVWADPPCSAWVERNLAPSPFGSFVYGDAVGASILYADGETWTWDGANWTNLNIPGPPNRAQQATAYDSHRGVVVLFGGQFWDGATHVDRGDTWEFDGNKWLQRESTGPNPRESALMCYDSQRRVALLYGGWPASGAAYYDLWEWNGEEWKQHAELSENWPKLFPSAFVFDSMRGVAVLIGYAASNSTSLDVWEWDGVTWIHRDSAPFEPYQIASEFDPSQGVALVKLYGLSTEETWSWDGQSWIQLLIEQVPFSELRQMAFDSDRHVLIDHGSLYGQVFDQDLREWTGTNWQTRWTSGPNQRPSYQFWPAMAFDSWRGVSVMYSGYYYAPYSDTWEWNGETWNLRSLVGASARQLHAMAFDSARGVTVMFGGIGDTDGVTASCCPQKDTWEWDGNSWLNRNVEGPSERYGHAMAYDEARGVTVLFGGRYDHYGSDSRTLGDTWEWNGYTWWHVSDEGPGARFGHTVAYDSSRGVIVLFGGSGEYVPGHRTEVFGDTWEWNGTAWRAVPEEGPLGRVWAGSIYDAARSVVVLEGGSNGYGAMFHDTWEWDGKTWHQRTLDGPAYRDNHAMVYDSWRDEVVSFGWTSNPTALWVYSPNNVGEDRDADLIADECDICPSTPSGVGVDSTGCAPADANLDGNIDLTDFAGLQNCETDSHPVGSCVRFDLFPDAWLTAIDFAFGFAAMTGPTR